MSKDFNVMEMNAAGNFRFTVPCTDDCKANHVSEWTPYQGIATLKVHGYLYACVTQYHAGVLPVEKVFVITEGIHTELRST